MCVGVCCYGDVNNMLLDIANFKGDIMTTSDITIAEYISKNDLSRVRLYILTKSFLELSSNSDDSDNDLQETIFYDFQSFNFYTSLSTTEASATTTSASAASTNRSSSKVEQDDGIYLLVHHLNVPH